MIMNRRNLFFCFSLIYLYNKIQKLIFLSGINECVWDFWLISPGFSVFQSLSSFRRPQFWDSLSGDGVSEATPLSHRFARRPLSQRPPDQKHHLQPQRRWERDACDTDADKYSDFSAERVNLESLFFFKNAYNTLHVKVLQTKYLQIKLSTGGNSNCKFFCMVLVLYYF